MFLAGLSIPDRDVLKLARLMGDAGFDEIAEKLETALERDATDLALTIDDQETILRALEDPPQDFAELRAALLRDHHSRARERLA